MNQELVNHLGVRVGANSLPYEIPIHPILVHFTLGLFIIGIFFDIAGSLFSWEKPILRLLALPALRAGFYDVGWYNVLASACITFITVAAGFFEIMLANPSANLKSDWGLGVGTTMLLHGLGGVFLLALIVTMTAWRGLQRYDWRKNATRQVQWSYLLAGIVVMGIMYVHGTLGGQMGDDFAIHDTAAGLLKEGLNPNSVFKKFS